MKNFRINLPVKYQGESIYLGGNAELLKLGWGRNEYIFIVNTRILFSLLLLILLTLIFVIVRFSFFNTTFVRVDSDASCIVTPVQEHEDVVGYFIDYFEEKKERELEVNKKFLKEKFVIEKQLLITKFLLEEKVSRPDQLSDASKLKLARQISELFIKTILSNWDVEPHVYRYFTDEEELRKIETAIIEQIKFHVPASVTLAQSALETGYGKRVINNNYFGIKDQSGKNVPIITTEYYNEKEFQANQDKIVSYTTLKKNNQILYKCVVRDSFASYSTAWESFRAHSLYLSQNPRYAPLFTAGKNYEAWAERIGSTKYGGVGYATSPLYGEILKRIIRRYQLHLLDF
ncbi:MAG: glucosaminidase domain-containing protein [Cytophagales bacterium]|nr:glucosaminidase domain-containing protein [Cytophagales bacterium]MDW8384949.1 glucosaminidase domain-containing protein [Flammeovirgaceae bacterium]